ncbi:MAG: bestrophin family protein [Salibacteraceae bacterium]
MYTKRNYSFWMTFNWSKKPFFIGFIYSAIIGAASYFLGLTISLPWEPISVVGIAVAFYLGFKNDSSYDRTWEARKIWGSIVNNSRSFGVAVVSFVQGENAEEIKKELIYRQIAWLTALRYQLRLSRPWEHTEIRVSGVYSPTICEEYYNKIDKDLLVFLSHEEIKQIESKTNMATQILKNQSVRLQELHDNNHFEKFRQMELHQLVVKLFEDQGKSERIKNFPFPRQYASTALWLTLVFCGLVPFGMIDIFVDHGDWAFIMFPVISALIIWIFFLMEKIGDYSENPFEGTYNDVPITTIARGIEIDLREMINDTNIPKPFETENGFEM